MSFYDSSTQQKGLQPLVYVDRRKATLTEEPEEIFAHEQRCPVIRTNFTVHNSNVEDSVEVVLRHLYPGDEFPGDIVDQFFCKYIGPGETVYLSLNKVMGRGDIIVGFCGDSGVVSVHIDFEAQH